MRGNAQYTTMEKSAGRNGFLLGELTAGHLARKLKVIRRVIRNSGCSEAVLQSRIRDFTALLKKVAPAWLEEAGGLADGAKINVDEILMMNCLPPDIFRKGGMNCTSFMRIGEKENLLFKIRDERNWTQHFFIKKNEGSMRFQAGTDIGNLGVAHFFNEGCLAGADNTGSASKDIADDVRLSDCHILRLFAEQCKNVDEARILLEKLLELNVVGGAGADRGMIFLLADPDRGMILECTSSACEARVVEKGIFSVSNHFLGDKAKTWELKEPSKNTLIRKKRIEELLNACGNHPELEDAMRFSRDRKSLPHALCNDDSSHFWMTLSVAIQIVNRRKPEDSLQWFCCGNTRNSFYLPFGIRERENFIPLANGDFYEAADQLYRKFGCGGHLAKKQRMMERRMMESVGGNGVPRGFEQEAFEILKETACG